MASSWLGSDLHGARPVKRPAAPGSPAAGSLKTVGQNVRLVSENKTVDFIYFVALKGHKDILNISIVTSCKATTHFEGTRSYVAAAAKPHLLYQISICLRNLASHSQGIFSVNLSLILVIKEVLCERRCIAQALEKKGKGQNYIMWTQ